MQCGQRPHHGCGRFADTDHHETHEYLFYDTLQVSRSANDAALQAAFKTLCEKYHPDKDPGDLVGATPEMLQLSEAYAVLSDSDKRFAYDLSLTKREREMRAEEEAKAAKAASSMFPPIVMPPDFPELPGIPPLPTAPRCHVRGGDCGTHAPAAAPGTAKVQSTPVHHPHGRRRNFRRPRPPADRWTLRPPSWSRRHRRNPVSLIPGRRGWLRRCRCAPFGRHLFPCGATRRWNGCASARRPCWVWWCWVLP
ncbi:MAG: J domain-containing protein [Burkholderiales bacterium]|nr:J domain-containing protein [Burkholderiales bacterium]